MIYGADFIKEATRCGFDFYTSVPCSYLTPLLNAVLGDEQLHHYMASSEGEAMAIAAGASLAGRIPVVMMQNSGLGNAVNPLTSLNHTFRIPTLLIISWRGHPEVHDEPQHEMMGKIMHRLLDLMEVPHDRFPTQADDIASVLSRARASIMERELPYALIVEPKSLHDEPLSAKPLVRTPDAEVHTEGDASAPLPTREEALRVLRLALPDSAGLVATTGKTGRELFALGDDNRNLYVVGSMGCASGVGLGIALNSDRPVVVIDGDGAALMKLGNLSTVGRYRPPSFIHVLINNGIHDSTGGQPTNSGNVNFSAIAAACGYAKVNTCYGVHALTAAIASSLQQEGPHFIHVPVKAGTMKDLPRPDVTPVEVGQRFAMHLQAVEVAA